MAEIDSGPRDYSMLDDSEKLIAILAIVREPVSRELAIEFSGVDTTQEGSKEKVEKAFLSTGMIETEKEGEKRYMVDDATKEELNKTIDLMSAEKVIADYLWKSMGLGE